MENAYLVMSKMDYKRVQSLDGNGMIAYGDDGLFYTCDFLTCNDGGPIWYKADIDHDDFRNNILLDSRAFVPITPLDKEKHSHFFWRF